MPKFLELVAAYAKPTYLSGAKRRWRTKVLKRQAKREGLTFGK